MLGLELASVLLKQEYGFDKTDLYLTNTTFIEGYVDGHIQSGAIELGLGSTWDKAHYVVVSSVHGEAESAVTAIFSCYDLQGANATIRVVKAGVITKEFSAAVFPRESSQAPLVPLNPGSIPASSPQYLMTIISAFPSALERRPHPSILTQYLKAGCVRFRVS
jgi:hypothetical protein